MDRRQFLKTAGAATAAAAMAAGAAGAVKEDRQPMKVLLWCWDARMGWDDEPGTVTQRMAAAEQKFPYPKRSEAFACGCRRLIDYCARVGIHGVILWGFLRDCHGGVKAAADLCKYASDRGVPILPGVGLCSYGGYYYEGDHPYNLDTYLRQHPERAGKAREEGSSGNSGPRREVAPVLDPSLEANQKWWREGLEWMLDTFEIGGVDYEMGDFIVNVSPEAEAARKALGFDADGNILDTVVATKGLMRRAVERRPNGIFIDCTYRGYHMIKNFPAMPYAQAMPKETVWEYTLTGMVNRPEFPDKFAGAPSHRKYGYLHWFNVSTKTAGRDYTADIARVFAGCRKLGFEFIGTYGEVSAVNNPVADANYRAQVDCAR